MAIAYLYIHSHNFSNFSHAEKSAKNNLYEGLWGACPLCRSHGYVYSQMPILETLKHTRPDHLNNASNSECHAKE